MHAVGADRVGDAGGHDRAEALGRVRSGLGQASDDGGTLPLALLDSRRVEKDRLREDDPGTALLDHGEVVVGRHRRVFDRPDARLGREGDAPAADRVGRHVGAGPLRFLDDRVKLGPGIAGVLKAAAGGTDAARQEHLEEVRAGNQVLPGGLPHLVHAVEGR